METNYTKGEWMAKEGQIYATGTGKTLALIPYFDEENKEEAANARLIAAAPELLNCCMDVLRIMDLKPTYTNQYQRNKIEDAIRKATEL